MPGRGTAVAIALLLCGVVLAAAGCGLGPGSGVGTVGLTVTREFGAVKLSESSGEANESDTVMRFLEGEDEISTRYGGGYVESIDGVSEGERNGHPYDWFFFVNGVLSPVGAAEVQLEGGEKVWWDIHDWAASEGVPAVVGSWPAPFTTGWEGHAPVVAIECDSGGAACGTVTAALEAEGVKIAAGAGGAGSSQGAGSSSGAAKSAIRVLVGPWAKLRSDPVAALVEKGPGESGIYADFAQSHGTWRLVGLDEEGKNGRSLGTDAGLVAATRRYEGPPVWLVTGGTGGAVRAAAAALNAEDLRDHYAVASEAGTVTPLPLSSGSR
ncbi:MAG TPA: DUF4430 domain-containing protein [Solirubrobacterales bacterium]|jgi:hypothetical protein|nr:DUF4430 domain-containing protein [Solirubrobacterales bacterium]